MNYNYGFFPIFNINNNTIVVDMDLEKTCKSCKELFPVTNKTFDKEDKCNDCKNNKNMNTCKIGLCITCRAAPVNLNLSNICNHCKMRFRS